MQLKIKLVARFFKRHHYNTIFCSGVFWVFQKTLLEVKLLAAFLATAAKDLFFIVSIFITCKFLLPHPSSSPPSPSFLPSWYFIFHSTVSWIYNKWKQHGSPSGMGVLNKALKRGCGREILRSNSPASIITCMLVGLWWRSSSSGSSYGHTQGELTTLVAPFYFFCLEKKTNAKKVRKILKVKVVNGVTVIIWSVK